MGDNLTAVLIVLASVFGLVCLRNLKFKSRDIGRMSAQETAAMEQMGQTAERLEQRVAVLEQILDAEAPAWRSNPANFYRQAG